MQPHCRRPCACTVHKPEITIHVLQPKTAQRPVPDLSHNLHHVTPTTDDPASPPVCDKEAESLRNIQRLLQGRTVEMHKSGGLYSSPHSRLRLHIKVPSPWDPKDLAPDFTSRLSSELSRSGLTLVNVAVRRGCIVSEAR